MAKVLVGFMGAGKTTVAGLLDPDFVDMDAVISQRIGMPIAQFFAEKGEAAFRAIESQVLAELVESDAVISTGGGVVESARNRDLLQQAEATVFLRADADTLIGRIVADTANQRPLFENQSREDFLALFERRQPLYEAVASQIIDVGGKTPSEIVELIK